jgi:hypothetical protein
MYTIKELVILCALIPALVSAQDSAVLVSTQDSTVLVSAQDSADKEKFNSHFKGFRVYHENDILNPVFSRNKDDNYTGGNKLEFITNIFSSAFQYRILNPLKWKPLHQFISINFTAFTPYLLADSNIVLTERPYASYQHIGFGASFWRENKKHKYSYEILLGEFGRAFTGKVQKYGHRGLKNLVNSKRAEPQGWHNQIAAGGAVAANIKVNYQYLFGPNEIGANKYNPFGAVLKIESNYGQYATNASLALRVIYSCQSMFPLVEGEPEISVPVYGDGKKSRWYYYITPKVRLVEHNATLTGQRLNKKSIHSIDPDDVNIVQAEYDIGAQYRCGVFSLGIALMGRSREYKKQEKLFHHWGAFQVGLVFK